MRPGALSGGFGNKIGLMARPPDRESHSQQPVGSTGFEPARPFGHKALNLARLPISPRALVSNLRPVRANTQVYSPSGERQAKGRGVCYFAYRRRDKMEQ